VLQSNDRNRGSIRVGGLWAGALCFTGSELWRSIQNNEYTNNYHRFEFNMDPLVLAPAPRRIFLSLVEIFLSILCFAAKKSGGDSSGPNAVFRGTFGWRLVALPRPGPTRLRQLLLLLSLDIRLFAAWVGRIGVPADLLTERRGTIKHEPPFSHVPDVPLGDRLIE
jgi:hypothetical protein